MAATVTPNAILVGRDSSSPDLEGSSPVFRPSTPRPGLNPLSRKLGAVAVATLLHLAIVVAVGLSMNSVKLQFQTTGGGGAMMASLTPASTLSGASAPAPSNFLDKIAPALDDELAVSPELPVSSSKGADLLADLDRSLSSPSKVSAPAPSAHAQTDRHPSSIGNAKPSLGAPDNPWAHASAAALNTSKTRQLWAAIAPCWRGHVDEGPASIRVVLGPDGKVMAMTALGNAEGEAASAAEALAAAVTACAPYRVGGADAYLVQGPI